MKKLACVLLACAVALQVSACKKQTGSSETSPSQARKQYDAVPDPASTGSVRGAVHFSGKAPERVVIDMSQDPACAFVREPNLSEQIVVERGNLANVFVYVQGAPHLAPSSQLVVVDQKGCRFIPHVSAVAAGGKVEFRNSDPTMHNVHSMAVQAGNRSVDLSQGPGAPPQQLKFDAPENDIPVRCNNHPWMNAFVNVSPNTFFAITGSDGEFTIPGLPAGAYTLVLVHEKLGEQRIPFSVKAGAVTPVQVSYVSK